MKVGLMIVGSRGLYILKNIKRLKDVKIEFVMTYSDNGTKENVYSNISRICDKNNIKLIDGRDCPKGLLNKVNKVFVIGWQYFIKGDLNKYVVLHDSYLPEKKGWAPTVSYLQEGSSYLAATAFQPTEVMDEGPVYTKKKHLIEHPMKIADALQIVSGIYFDLIKEICKNKLEPAFDDTLVEPTISAWRDERDYFIDWSCSAEEIQRKIYALGHPYNGARFKIQDGYMYNTEAWNIYTVKECEVVKMKVCDVESHYGKVIRIDDGSPVVICGRDAVKLSRIKSMKSSCNDFELRKLKTRFE